LWVITLCSVVEVYRRFRGMYCLHRHGEIIATFKGLVVFMIKHRATNTHIRVEPNFQVFLIMLLGEYLASRSRRFKPFTQFPCFCVSPTAGLELERGNTPDPARNKSPVVQPLGSRYTV
jgi:hypothetical protein